MRLKKIYYFNNKKGYIDECDEGGVFWCSRLPTRLICECFLWICINAVTCGMSSDES